MSLPEKSTVEATNGHHISCQLVADFPCVCYVDAAGNLRFARNPNIDGSGVWVLTTVIAAGVNTFTYTSLLVVQGFPAIAYQNTLGGVTGLYYVRATNNIGSAWGAPVTVISTAGKIRGSYCSMFNVNGNPAIAYQNETDNIVEYIRATNATGTTWGSVIPVSQPLQGGIYVNLRVFNNTPAVTYFNPNSVRLIYIKSNTITGLPYPSISPTWADPIFVDINSAGSHCSLGELDNEPMISYYEIPTISNLYQNLKFTSVREGLINNNNGFSPDAIVIVSSRTSDGATSVNNAGGLPIIAYRDSNNGSLNIATTKDALGFTNWYLQVLDDSMVLGGATYISTLTVGNQVGIFYNDLGGNVFYIFYITPSGSSSGGGGGGGGGSLTGASFGHIKSGAQTINVGTTQTIAPWTATPSPPLSTITGWNLVTGVYTAAVAQKLTIMGNISWAGGLGNVGTRTVRIVFFDVSAAATTTAAESIVQASADIADNTVQSVSQTLLMDPGDQAWLEATHTDVVNLDIANSIETTVSGIRINM